MFAAVGIRGRAGDLRGPASTARWTGAAGGRRGSGGSRDRPAARRHRPDVVRGADPPEPGPVPATGDSLGHHAVPVRVLPGVPASDSAVQRQRQLDRPVAGGRAPGGAAIGSHHGGAVVTDRLVGGTGGADARSRRRAATRSDVRRPQRRRRDDTPGAGRVAGCATKRGGADHGHPALWTFPVPRSPRAPRRGGRRGACEARPGGAPRRQTGDIGGVAHGRAGSGTRLVALRRADDPAACRRLAVRRRRRRVRRHGRRGHDGGSGRGAGGSGP